MIALFHTRTALCACALILAAVSTPGAALTVVTNGVADSDDPFNFILNPGESFVLDFGAASIDMPSLFNLEDGVVVASFYVETSPGIFDIGIGLDNTVLSCSILPGGNCTDTAFGPVSISLAESAGIITGSYSFGPAFDNCFAAGQTPVDGVECGRDFAFLPRMLFDVTFLEPGMRYPYELSITSGAVPEPVTWAMMIGGIGAVGAMLRRRSKVSVSVSFA